VELASSPTHVCREAARRRAFVTAEMMGRGGAALLRLRIQTRTGRLARAQLSNSVTGPHDSEISSWQLHANLRFMQRSDPTRRVHSMRPRARKVYRHPQLHQSGSQMPRGAVTVTVLPFPRLASGFRRAPSCWLPEDDSASTSSTILSYFHKQQDRGSS
jgi:hypothetical protein